MKINIPDNVIRKIIASYLPSQWDGIGIPADDSRLTFKRFVADEIMKKIGEVELPVISKEELKKEVLSRMADKAIEEMNK